MTHGGGGERKSARLWRPTLYNLCMYEDLHLYIYRTYIYKDDVPEMYKWRMVACPLWSIYMHIYIYIYIYRSAYIYI